LSARSVGGDEGGLVSDEVLEGQQSGETPSVGAGQGWDPGQYGRFERERSQPFYDLAALVERRPALRVLDLGCGTGELTAWLHRELGAEATLGVDRAESMLDQAAEFSGGGVRFEQGTIEARLDSTVAGDWGLVFSNAALQWLPDHELLLPAVAKLVGAGGQLAIQMPANAGHPSHQIARELGRDTRFAGPLGGFEREDTVRAPEWYAEQLHALGFEAQQVRMQVYGHVLPETRSVIEWVKGSLLTPYRERLTSAMYSEFLAEYEGRLVSALADHSPFFYPFKRLFLWARRGV
jgi:trans-aconitate 2-methyltransferase